VDFSEAHDLAADMPDELHETPNLWFEQAKKYDVDPARPIAALGAASA